MLFISWDSSSNITPTSATAIAEMCNLASVFTSTAKLVNVVEIFPYKRIQFSTEKSFASENRKKALLSEHPSYFNKNRYA